MNQPSQQGLKTYLSSCNTVCGAILAWASMAVAACWRILFLVNSIISLAISTSRMRDSDAARFSEAAPRLLMVWSNLFCQAPRFDLWVETVVIAASMAVIAKFAELLLAHRNQINTQCG